MVKDNCWEFQASVWDAAQQQLQKHQQHQHEQHKQEQQEQQEQQHSEASNEGGSEERPDSSSLPGRDDSGESIPQFQNTDLPHPGWGEIVYSQT